MILELLALTLPLHGLFRWETRADTGATALFEAADDVVLHTNGRQRWATFLLDGVRGDVTWSDRDQLVWAQLVYEHEKYEDALSTFNTLLNASGKPDVIHEMRRELVADYDTTSNLRHSVWLGKCEESERWCAGASWQRVSY